MDEIGAYDTEWSQKEKHQQYINTYIRNLEKR